jgi:hypothetical protein
VADIAIVPMSKRQEALNGLSRHAFEAGLYDRNRFPEDGQDL